MDNHKIEIPDDDWFDIEECEAPGSSSNSSNLEENELLGRLEVLCHSSRSSSPIPSTSTGITDYDSGQFGYLYRPDLGCNYNHSSSSSCCGNMSVKSLPIAKDKRPRSSKIQLPVFKKRRAQKANTERRRCCHFRKCRVCRKSITSVKMKRSKLTASSKSHLGLPLLSNIFDTANPTELKRSSASHHMSHPECHQQDVIPVSTSHRNNPIQKMSESSKSSVSRYRPGNLLNLNTEHETSNC